MAINFPDPSQQTTYVADSGVTYEFIDGVWKATTFAGLGDVRYVNSTGDDMSGNLTIATDKISLNTDGSASFAGTVDANALTVDGTAVDTSTQVDAKIAAIPPTDLSAYDTSAEVTAKVTALETSLTDGAPGALDTLNELAASLGDDSNFAGTVTNSLAGKANLSGATFTGEIKVEGSSTPSGEFSAISRFGSLLIGTTSELVSDAKVSIDSSSGLLSSDGGATFTGDVTASAFIGDGSQLTGVGSETIISSTPPTPADYEVGTMWWNSDSTDTSLYILYQDPTGPNGDAGGKYWIEAAPAPDSIGFDGTHTGDSTFTGNMNVTGTASFAGGLLTIDVAGAINTSSGLAAQNKSGYGDSEVSVILGLNTAGTHTTEIFADGSASFAGDVTVSSANIDSISGRFQQLSKQLADLEKYVYNNEKKSNTTKIQNYINKISTIRKKTQPISSRTSGSTFQNP